MSSAHDETPLWSPSQERKAESRLTEYLAWLAREKGLRFEDYDALWRWSVAELSWAELEREVASRDAMANPASLDYFVDFARRAVPPGPPAWREPPSG